MISCCVALPLAFYVELEPCWRCRDLNAALAHEVGHALGLDDATAYPSASLHRRNGSAYDCLKPWEGVEVGAAGAAEADVLSSGDALMAFWGPLVQLVNRSYNATSGEGAAPAYQNVDGDGRRYGLRGRAAWRRTISTR